MKRPEINCKIGIDDPWDMIKKQYLKNLLKFCDIKSPVKFDGHFSELYFHLANVINYHIYNNKGKYNTIFVVDIIESKLNPEHYLRSLKKRCNRDTKVYITCPYRWNSYFWNWNHWHEIDPRRFAYLADQAGFRITKQMRKKIWHEWWWYFRGIRPFLRLFVHYNHYYYELRLK